MNEIAPSPRPRHILVALDASPHSVAALMAAAELAALMEAELEGLFVEDINLLRLCGLPFGREIGSYSATARRLDNAGVERQLRALADTIEAVMARITATSAVPWRFSVRRGPVVAVRQTLTSVEGHVVHREGLDSLPGGDHDVAAIGVPVAPQAHERPAVEVAVDHAAVGPGRRHGAIRPGDQPLPPRRAEEIGPGHGFERAVTMPARGER